MDETYCIHTDGAGRYAVNDIMQQASICSEKENADEAYLEIKADVEACGAGESLQQVLPVYKKK